MTLELVHIQPVVAVLDLVHVQPVSSPLELVHVQPVVRPTNIELVHRQVIPKVQDYQLVHVQPVPAVETLELVHVQPLPETASLELVHIQPTVVAGNSLELVHVQPVESSDRRPLELVHVQPVLSIGGVSSESYVLTVTAGGVEIHPEEITIVGARDSFTIECTLILPDQADRNRCTPLDKNVAAMDSATRAAHLAAARIVVTVNGEERRFLCTSRSRSRGDGSSYTIKAESDAVLMRAPYAMPMLTEYEPDQASVIAGDIVAGFGVDFDWNIVDARIPANTLYANDETAVEVVRKPVNDYGCILQSNILGGLAAVDYYPYPLTQWATCQVDYYITDGEMFITDDEQVDQRDGYNAYLVGNTLQSSDSLNFEETTISPGIKEVRGYVVPWTGDALELDTSGPDRVIIGRPRIVVERIEEEEVEFVAGSGKTAKPITNLVDVEYGDNRQLGAVTPGEDGTLEADVAGQSLALVTYDTTCWLWRVADAVSERVQLFAEPVWSDLPVTIVVDFADAAAAAGFVIVEADAALNVDENDEVKSEFSPGESFHFLVQHDDTVQIKSVRTSSGTVSSRGIVGREKNQQVSFVDESAVELPTIPSGAVQASWYGRSPSLTRDGRSLTPDVYPAIGELSWSAAMHSYRLTPPSMDLDGDDKYYILVVVEMESV